MTQSNKMSNVFNAMVYGDALGFLRENTKEMVDELAPFVLTYDKDLSLPLPKGQWSYITELMLIIIKCLVDEKEKWRVEVDYNRMKEELYLWKYYRHGSPLNILEKIGKKEDKKEDKGLLWNDQRGWGICRIVPIVLANKNYRIIEEETYKNIIEFNRHPQVILTSLLIARSFYILLEEEKSNREYLIGQLKKYLIHIRLQDLEGDEYGQLPKHYILAFEKEKINYLMDLGRLFNVLDLNLKEGLWNGKRMFLVSLVNYFCLCEQNKIDTNLLPKEDQKESFALSYGMWAIHQDSLTFQLGNLKNQEFIHNMGNYLSKLRNYEVGKKKYMTTAQTCNFDIFRLTKGQVLRHPILNVIKVRERVEEKGYLRMIVEAKSGVYHFIRQRMK